MCIVMYKPKGEKMPGIETLKTCWRANSDGAGYMFAHGGRVFIKKGLMTLDALTASLVDLSKKHDINSLPLVLHFRYATHGSKGPEMTHPFPVSKNVSDLISLDCSASMAMAHNGIMSMTSDTVLSDSAIFARDILSEVKNSLDDQKTMLLINTIASGSKVIVMDGQGNVSFLGAKREAWVKDGGVLFSNSGFMPVSEPIGYYPFWEDDYKGYRLDAGKYDKTPEKEDYYDYFQAGECPSCQSIINLEYYGGDVCPVCGDNLIMEG